MEKNKNLSELYKNNGTVLFDGFCNLCSWSVQFIIKRDPKDYFRFASLQSEIAIEILGTFSISESFDKSVVLIENQKIYFKSDAALRIARRLNKYWKYLYYLIYFPRFIRNFVYDLIAKNRFRWFGRKESCFIPEENLIGKFLD